MKANEKRRRSMFYRTAQEHVVSHRYKSFRSDLQDQLAHEPGTAGSLRFRRQQASEKILVVAPVVLDKTIGKLSVYKKTFRSPSSDELHRLATQRFCHPAGTRMLYGMPKHSTSFKIKSLSFSRRNRAYSSFEVSWDI